MHVYLISLFLISVIISPVLSSVSGIDFGSQFIKGSFIKPGKQFVIIENQQTKRKTEAAVTLDFDRRHFGPDAIQKLSKLPLQSLVFMQRLLGQSYDDEIWRKEFEEWRYPYQFTKNPRGTINVKISEDEEYSVEEINAMILSYLNELLLKQAAEDIKDCVVTIPAYFTYFQRKTMIDTLKLGNWNPLALTSENVAASIFYGINQNFDSNKVILFNLGSTSLEVALVNFTLIKKVGSTIPHGIVLGEAWDFHVGANDVDLVIQSIILDRIKQDSTKDLSIKSLHRIKSIAEKAKKTLSANKEVLLNEVELYEGKNLKMTITRNQVEEKLLAQGWDQKLIQPLQSLLDQTKLTPQQIDQIEMIGGGVRIPLVQQTIQNFMKKELGWHINGDEDMANGIALLAANFSSTMSVRTPILLTQKPYHKYKAVIYDKEGFQRETALDKAYGAKKDVSLTVKNDFWVDLYENDAIYLRYKVTGTEKPLTTAQEGLLNKTGGQAIENPVQLKVFITFKVNNFGYAELEAAKSQRHIFYYDLENKNQTKEDDILEFGEDAVLNSSSYEKPKWILKNQTDKWELRVRNLDLVDENGEWLVSPRLMSFNDIVESQKKLSDLDQRDKDWSKLVEMRNSLESLIYQVKENQDSPDFILVTTEDQRTVLKEKLVEVEDWLYGDGAKATIQALKNQSQPILDIVMPAQDRIFELRNREKAIDWAMKSIKSLYGYLASLFAKMPWVDKQKQEETYNAVNKTVEWLDEVTLKQKEKQPHEEPVFKVDQIEQRMKKIEEIVKKVEQIPKPVNKTKTEKKPKDTFKPIKIGDKSYTIEEFEEYQKEQQRLREEEEAGKQGDSTTGQKGSGQENTDQEELRNQQFEEKPDL